MPIHSITVAGAAPGSSERLTGFPFIASLGTRSPDGRGKVGKQMMGVKNELTYGQHICNGPHCS